MACHLRFFHNNSKIVLYDLKFASLDSSFHKGPAIAVDDDMEMEKHLVTVEGLTTEYAINSMDPKGPGIAISNKIPSTTTKKTSIGGSECGISRSVLRNTTTPEIFRKKWKAPFSREDSANPPNESVPDDHPEKTVSLQSQSTVSRAIGKTRPNNAEGIVATGSGASFNIPPIQPTPKRRKIGLTRMTGSSNNTTLSPASITQRIFGSQLEFPNAARCTNFTGKNSSQLLKRTLKLGARFTSAHQYKDGMTSLIYEHLQLLIVEIAITMWGIKNGSSRTGDQTDSVYRSRGVNMYSSSTLRRKNDTYSGFPVFSERGTGSTGVSTVSLSSGLQSVILSVSNKEHHSRYSKDDLWVVSYSSRFEPGSYFFARSVFYGPSGSEVEVTCISAKDSTIARDMFSRSTNSVSCIRLLNAMSEFMMLDNLVDSLTRLPLLPVILNYVPPEIVKASKTSVFRVPSRVPEKSGFVVLTEEDGIDVEAEVQDTISQYKLNADQAEVLRKFALTVIRAPGWSDNSDSPPALLVRGVFGAGKSFLIAVLIVFIDSILSKARPLPPEERSCRFLVSSMTNVAVDRILTALLDLNFTNFVRVGSLKKVAKQILPFTAQSNTSKSNEDVKELQSILNDDSLSVSERRYVKDAIKRFQKQDNRGIVGDARVVGVTCIASSFEVLDGASFPIVIIDEASQLLEAMSILPICRVSGEKLILVGDPQQLSPPLSTSESSSGSGYGLSRTLFDRMTEMGIKPIMLRTQYRCHHRIADISSSLFYSNCLRTGVSEEERAPLIENLPTLTFIETGGQEVQDPRTKSFTNIGEVKLVVSMIQHFLHLNIPESDIGVISLYKSQAEKIESEMTEYAKKTGRPGGVQISTVDAFQGSEKEVIILSTVRTNSIGFIDNKQRVNVALTRSRRY
ncbi:hypothetical protein BGW38_008729 [Lunasporangiospora selenospora]|uniref:AAA domain-containing protein n=1 Tax=Lunasporangiospora selenospora TaxID=979761 RepID=A0A9P6G4L7_9FUNG|nr:hypothetical protein BGW38_008729 [Lunasporangiospora selenospora]